MSENQQDNKTDVSGDSVVATSSSLFPELDDLSLSFLSIKDQVKPLEQSAEGENFTRVKRPTPSKKLSRQPQFSFPASAQRMPETVQYQGGAAVNMMREDMVDRPKRLHVSNIPFRFREHNLVMLFGKFGYVKDAEIIYNDMGSKGFGFVTMMRGQDAYRALLKLNNTTIEGRIIMVNLATPKVHGYKRTLLGIPPGVTYTDHALGSLAASKALAEAEARLAEAKLEVLKIRTQLKYPMYNERL